MWKNLFKELKRKDHQRYLGGLDIFKAVIYYPTQTGSI